MKKKAAQILKYILSLAIAGLLLYFAFRGIDWKEFWEGLKTTDWGWIAASVVSAVAALVFRAERWRLQLVTIDPDVKRSTIWHGSNIGNFMSLIIPGIGEFIRCGHVSSKRSGYDKTFGTILVERTWDILSIGLLLLLAVVLGGSALGSFLSDEVLAPFYHRFSFSIWWVFAAAVLILAAVVAAVFIFKSRSRLCGKLANAVLGILQGVSAFGRMDRKWLFLLYTACIWVCYILMAYFTMLAVPGLQHLAFRDALFISAVGNIASVVPTPGNLGAYHYIVGLAVSTIYLGSTTILAEPLLFATLSHGSHAALLIVLAIHSYIMVSIRKNPGGNTKK